MRRSQEKKGAKFSSFLRSFLFKSLKRHKDAAKRFKAFDEEVKKRHKKVKLSDELFL